MNATKAFENEEWVYICQLCLERHDSPADGELCCKSLVSPDIPHPPRKSGKRKRVDPFPDVIFGKDKRTY